MATITKGYSFGASELVTNAKLHTLVDSATISGITASDIQDFSLTNQDVATLASIAGSKLAGGITEAKLDITSAPATGKVMAWDGSKMDWWAQTSLLSISSGDVTALASLTNNYLIRGDGGSNGIQTSTPLVDDSGRMINASQPCFQAYASAAQANMSIGTDVTIVFGTEAFDQGSNFASNTFTAPVTGKYALVATVSLTEFDSAADYYYLKIVTSNSAYSYYKPGKDLSADDTTTITISIVADMDVNDTAHVIIHQSGGTQQADAYVDRSTINFSGCLLA